MIPLFLNQSIKRYFILLIFILSHVLCYSQSDILKKTINIQAYQGSAKELLKLVEQNNSIVFSYTSNISLGYELSFQSKQLKLNEFLETLFKGKNISYKAEGNKVILYKDNTTRNVSIPTQTVRGIIIDEDSKMPLIGATIVLNDGSFQIGCTADQDGYYKLENIPVGRISIKASYIGYKSIIIEDIIVKPGKESYVTVKLEETITELGTVVIKGGTKKDKPVSDMALISARSFTIEETEKFAGSWGDPSRMASNYAGVTQGNDENNDIIIRGNSPSGLIWMLEGVPIPNPNHFDGLGATGGPISMLNNNLLKRSDFYTSAFPSEFGNGISGVFNLKLREGNFETREYVFQLGANGFELGAEGPIFKKNKSTYIINYRHSMLGLVNQFLSVEGLPKYKDLTLKLNFPYKKGKVSAFALGGTSKIEDEIFGLSSEGQLYKWGFDYNGSKTAIAGLNHMHFISEKLRIETALSVSTKRPYLNSDSLISANESNIYYKEEEIEDQLYAGTKISAKINAKNKVEVGGSLNNYNLNYKYEDKRPLVKENNMTIFQSYAQWKYKFTNNLIMNAGVNYKKFLYNNSSSIEPRLAFKWNYRTNSSFSIGYGNHGQTQPLYVYTLKSNLVGNNYIQPNKDLDFTKSHHFVLGHDLTINEKQRIKIETYYQRIYNVPVDKNGGYFSMLNVGESGNSILNLDSLVNKGTGENYGVELTIERFLNNNFYYLLTASLFNSKYIDGDKIERNTVYNGNYVVNALAGYEFKLNKRSSIRLNMRGIVAGGRRLLEVDEAKSIANSQTNYVTESAYKNKVEDYLRVDLKIAYILYGRKITQELAVDITNLTNRQNELRHRFDFVTNSIVTSYQQGIFPVVMYRINF